MPLLAQFLTQVKICSIDLYIMEYEESKYITAHLMQNLQPDFNQTSSQIPTAIHLNTNTAVTVNQ